MVVILETMFHGLILSLQVAASVSSPAPPSDIVVTASGMPKKKEVRRRVEQILPPLSPEQPLARFTVPVCPGVMGLTRPAAQAIVDRIGIVAHGIGLRVGEPGCAPNLIVLIVPDSRATVHRLADRHPGNVAGQSLADVRRIVAEPGFARAWVEADIRSRDGRTPNRGTDGVAEVTVQGANLTSLTFRRNIVAAYVVIDAAGVGGRDPIQIADYAAMRGLVDGRPGRAATRDSILSAFMPDSDDHAPTSLTDLDRNVLRGVYSGQGNRPAFTVQGDIAAAFLKNSGIPAGK